MSNLSQLIGSGSSTPILGELIQVLDGTIDTSKYVDVTEPKKNVLLRVNFPEMDALVPAQPVTVVFFSNAISESYGKCIADNGAGVIVTSSIKIGVGGMVFYRSVDGGHTGIKVYEDPSHTVPDYQSSTNVIWDGTRFVAVLEEYATTNIHWYSSPDGLTWTYHKTTNEGTINVVNVRLAYGGGKYFLTSNYSPYIYTTTDPIASTFSAASTPIFAPSFYVFDGTTHFLFKRDIIDYNGVLLTNAVLSSADGLTWSIASSSFVGTPGKTDPAKAKYNYINPNSIWKYAGTYYMVTSRRDILKSTDLLNWTLSIDLYTIADLTTSGYEGYQPTFFYTGTEAVVGGLFNQFTIYWYKSTDMINWSMVSQSIPSVTQSYGNVAFSLQASSTNYNMYGAGLVQNSHDPATEILLPSLPAPMENNQVKKNIIQAMRVKP